MTCSTAQTDLGPRSRTFSLKIKKLPKFLKSFKCGKIVYGQMSLHTEFQLHIRF